MSLHSNGRRQYLDQAQLLNNLIEFIIPYIASHYQRFCNEGDFQGEKRCSSLHQIRDSTNKRSCHFHYIEKAQR